MMAIPPGRAYVATLRSNRRVTANMRRLYAEEGFNIDELAAYFGRTRQRVLSVLRGGRTAWMCALMLDITSNVTQRNAITP